MSINPARARDLAHQILSRAPFMTSHRHLPNPLGGVFTALGRALKFAFGGFLSWLGHHLLAPIGGALTGADGVIWSVVTILACAAAGSGVVWLMWRRRTRPSHGGDRAAASPVERVSADELDRRASRAEQAGEFARAVTLRFQAGVERLTELGVVANGRARTNHQLEAALRNGTFADLAATHERIVYGEETATSEDAAHAAWGWPEVVRSARRDSEAVGTGAR